VRALNGAGVRYILDGAWFLDPAYDAPLFWKGHLVIPRQHKAVYETFVALASIAYEPRPATSRRGLKHRSLGSPQLLVVSPPA
jgi:hypothetical protein